MIENLLTTPTTRMLEQTVDFTERRNEVLTSDIANVDTVGYVQKDMDVSGFQAKLRKALSQQQTPSAHTAEETATVDETSASPVFHDKGVRGMETMMSDLADNAIAHNTATQLLKFQYDMISRAISMKV